MLATQKKHDAKADPAVDAGEIAVYAEPLLATRVAQNFGIKLLEPPDDFLPSLPESWRKRSVLLTTMKEARLSTEPRFIKSAAGKEFDAREIGRASCRERV